MTPQPANLLGGLHLWSALLAIVAGAVILLRPKGTTLHRLTGYVYLVAMTLMLYSAFRIYRLFGDFGPFHYAAVVSSVCIVLGAFHAFRRWPRDTWVEHHAMWLCWSYIGLIAAGVSEVSTRYLAMNFGLTVAIASFLVILVGYVLIKLKLPAVLARFRPGSVEN